MKIKELSEKLEPGYAAFIVSETNRLYFTEFAASNGILIVTRDDAVFITDSRYFEAAQQEAKDCSVQLQLSGANFRTQINEILHERDVHSILAETSRLTVSEAGRYKDFLCDFDFVCNDALDNAINSLRSVKTEVEKQKILNAQRIAESAYTEVLGMVKPGVSERDIAIEFDYLMRRKGADGISFETIVVAGENSSKPHGVPGTNKVKNGDFVTFDFGALLEGYHSDTTRTVAVGSVSDEQRRVYDTVYRAQIEGVNALKAGLGAREADTVCRDIIKSEGYGDFFGHSTGHGVGVEIHEFPYLGPNVKDSVVLKTGNVVTIEPGIYIPGRFGVRIEDMLFVTDDGAYNFVTLPKGLIVL